MAWELGLTCELLPVRGKAGIRKEREEENVDSFAKTLNWIPQKNIGPCSIGNEKI